MYPFPFPIPLDVVLELCFRGAIHSGRKTARLQNCTWERPSPDAHLHIRCRQPIFSGWPLTTLKAWTFGPALAPGWPSSQFRTVDYSAESDEPMLSFTNLVEAHVLRAIRGP